MGGYLSAGVKEMKRSYKDGLGSSRRDVSFIFCQMFSFSIKLNALSLTALWPDTSLFTLIIMLHLSTICQKSMW